MSKARFKVVTPMLEVRSIDETVEFYQGILGFTVDTLWPEDEPSVCFLDRDSVNFGFYVDPEQDDDDALGFTGQFYLDVDNVLQLHEEIKDRVEVLWGPEVYFYGRREFAISDPNGYTVTFSEPTDELPTSSD